MVYTVVYSDDFFMLNVEWFCEKTENRSDMEGEKHMRKEPIMVKGERVWRTYLGGREIGRLHGEPDSQDDHFPEEWMYSVTQAFNVGREGITEGLCKIQSEEEKTLKEYIEKDPEEILGEGHVKIWGNTPGVLIKMIDSQERLTVQVHPDKEKAKTLFGSDFGKTECWYILGTREDSEDSPCIYLGFREGITRKQWEECFFEQDYGRMLGLMNRLEVKDGETYLVKGGVPHAIGAGCMIIEIQEPTDYTIRVEKVTPSGFCIDDRMCHQGLGFEKMFDCFKYEGKREDEIREEYCILPTPTKDGGCCLVGYKDTPCFQIYRYSVREADCLNFEREEVFSCLYVCSGSGILRTDSCEYRIERNSQFFVPAGSEKYCIINNGDSPIEMLKMYGPISKKKV